MYCSFLNLTKFYTSQWNIKCLSFQPTNLNFYVTKGTYFTIFLVVTCSDPTPANGTGTVVFQVQEPTSEGIFYEKTLFIFSCNSGFNLQGTIGSLCGVDGEWHPTPPICEGNNITMHF